MRDYVCCGMYNVNGQACEVYADRITGEVVLDSDIMGPCVMSELTVLDPVQFTSDSAAASIIKYFECDGVILSNRNIITLRGTTAEFRDCVNTADVVTTIEFDTDIVAEDFN